MVQTVCGSVRAEELGHFQIHEHIWAHPTPMADKNPALCMDNPEYSLAELKTYREAGGGGIADAQPVAAGRDPLILKKLSEESRVHIVAATGYHLTGFYAEGCWVRTLEEDALFELYASELEQGMLQWRADPTVRPDRTDVKAGLVKAAIPEEGPIGRYETLLRAASRAAADSHVPLMLHTERGRCALEALRICFEAGLAPEDVIVCHVDRQASDFSPHDRLASAGVWLDYDTIGRFKYHSDEEEIALLEHMSPYAGQVLLALDTTAARLHSYGGEIGLDYLLNVFFPRLRQVGFREETIRAYTSGNCHRLFLRANAGHPSAISI